MWEGGIELKRRSERVAPSLLRDQSIGGELLPGDFEDREEVDTKAFDDDYVENIYSQYAKINPTGETTCN